MFWMGGSPAFALPKKLEIGSIYVDVHAIMDMKIAS